MLRQPVLLVSDQSEYSVVQSHSKFRATVVWVLLLNFCFTSLFWYAPQARAQSAASHRLASNSNGAPAEPSTVEERALHNELGNALLDPRLAAIENSPHDPRFYYQIASNSPLLDENPYFLRGQNWTRATSGPASGSAPSANINELEVAFSSQSISVRPRGQTVVWTAPVALRPVLATEEFLYFSAADASLFSRVRNAQGLFVVSYPGLLAASAAQEPVPIYFMPLPGARWVGDLRASEHPDRDAIVVQDTEHNPLPILVSDVRSVVKVGVLNRLLASQQAFMHAVRRYQVQPNDLQRLREGTQSLANRMATLARSAMTPNSNRQQAQAAAAEAIVAQQSVWFDLISQVMGRDRARDFMVLPANATAGFGLLFNPTDEDLAVTRQAGLSVKNLSQKFAAFFSLPQAHAEGAAGATAGLLSYAYRVLAISGSIYVAGVLARYTVLKDRMDALKREDAAAGRSTSEIRYSFDIFAASATVLAQIPTVWTGRTVRWVFDSIRIAENGLMNQLVKATLGFGVLTSDRTPVNAQTLLMGVVVLGGVDTLLVAIQGYGLLPALAWLLAKLVPALAPRVHAAYSSENAAVALYLLLGVVQNFIAYLTSGAYSFAHDVQQFRTMDAQRIIRDAMLAEARDPTAAEHRDEYDRRVEEYVRAEMLKQKLPGAERFLFDAGTLFENFQALFGYVAPEELRLRSGQNGSEQPSGHVYERAFRAVARPGLLGRGLDRAIESVQREVQANPETLEAQETLRQLNAARDQVRLLTQLRLTASESGAVDRSSLLDRLRALRSWRQRLVALTFEGQHDAEITEAFLPEGWTVRTAQAFRHGFFDLIDGAAPEPRWWTRSKSVTSHPFARVEAFYALWQVRRALNRANEVFIAETQTEPPALNLALTQAADREAPEVARYRRIVSLQLLRAVGITSDPNAPEFHDRIQAAAHSNLARLEETEAFQTALAAQRSDGARNRLRASRLATFLAEGTVAQGRSELSETAPMSPSLPGRFQAWRQTNWVRNSPGATRVLRILEGAYSNTHYELGLLAQMRRGLPVLNDVLEGNLLTVRGFPVAATVAYWYSAFIWNSAYPRMTWFINFMMAGTTIRGPWMTTQRMVQNIGVKPNQSVRHMLAYGTLGSFMTMWGMFIFPLFQADIRHALEALLARIQNTGAAVVNACSSLLSP